MRILSSLLCSGLISFALPNTAVAQEPKHRVWFSIEKHAVDPTLCQQKNVCFPVSNFDTHLAEEASQENVTKMANSLTELAKLRGYDSNELEPPKMCQHVEAAKVLGFDPEQWPESEKLDTLIGLKGVYVALQTLKAPPGYEGPFGEQIQSEVVRKFAAAGIRILTEEERDQTPGKPHLNLYFSHTNPNTGCWFSVFSSLTQTALLTRNHTTKFKTGTWGFSGGYSADDPERAEYDAILLVIDKFIADYTTANTRGPKTGQFNRP